MNKLCAWNVLKRSCLRPYSVIRANGARFFHVGTPRYIPRNAIFPSIKFPFGSITSLEAPVGCRSLSTGSKPKSGDDGIKTLQDLPDQIFWTDVFTDLVANYSGNAPEGAKIEKWLKMPRDHVKAGENILDLEVGGAVLTLRSQSSGYVGAHMVKEGELLEKGTIATKILSAPEPLPRISAVEYAKVLNDAEGSVAEVEERLKEIEAERIRVLGDFVAACRLLSLHGLSETPSFFITRRIPGRTASFFIPASGYFGAEITEDLILDFHLESATWYTRPKTHTATQTAPTDIPAIDVDTKLTVVHCTLLKALGSRHCTLQVAPPFATEFARTAAAAAAVSSSTAALAAASRVLSVVGFHDALALEGIAGPGEEEQPTDTGLRLAGVLGDARVLLRGGGEGVVVAADTLAVAFDTALRLERACRSASLSSQFGALLGAPPLTAFAGAPKPKPDDNGTQEAAKRFAAMRRRMEDPPEQ